MDHEPTLINHYREFDVVLKDGMPLFSCEIYNTMFILLLLARNWEDVKFFRSLHAKADEYHACRP